MTVDQPGWGAPAMSRRGLFMGSAAAGLAVSAVGSALPASAASSWPGGRLGRAAAEDVVEEQFFSTSLLARYGAEANDLGLRATGARNTEQYLVSLEQRLKRAGLVGVERQPVPMKQWLATDWGLTVDGRSYRHTFYVPYTAPTAAEGLTADLVHVPLFDALAGGLLRSPEDITAAIQGAIGTARVAGKIAVFEVAYLPVPLTVFAGLAHPGGFQIGAERSPTVMSENYTRPWLNVIGQVLDLLADAGAVGTIGIWTDLPGSFARQYTPYDGVFRPLPGLWVDSTEGARLKQLAAGGASATMTLRAKVRDTITHNVVGYVPGRTNELTMLHTHTDGTNGMEENGQIGILAIAQYLARLPRKSLGRTVMVMLSSGHFAGGVGIKHFLERYVDTLVPRVTSILCLEHLGCVEWKPDGQGGISPTGLPELGAYFTPNAPATVDPCIEALTEVGVTGVVARPFYPRPEGPVNQVGWPGEGTYWWEYGGLLTSNYITGPYGLITADLDTTGMVDYDLMRRVSIASARTVVRMANATADELTVSPV